MPLWGGSRAPFTLLGGYLGAGKTTVVNRVVRAAGGRRVVVLVNDVGTIDVDAALIADHDGTTLTLTNGCVCCALADDFTETLELVRAAHEPPDHVLMELSGVAEPARVAPWANTAGFRLDGIVVAADADQIVELARREYVGDTIREQLRAADLVLLTKTDLTGDGGAVARAFVALQSDAPVVDVIDGDVDVELVLGLGPSVAPAAAGRSHAPYEVAVVDPGSPTRAGLDRLVAALPPNVLRAKGLVACNDEAAPVEVHVVGRRRVVRVRPDLDGARAGGIVVISAPS
jgi:G3E family GTPase